MFKIIHTIFAGIFIASSVSSLIGDTNMIEHVSKLLSNWFWILSLTSVIMCIVAAYYFDWFRELRYPELRFYAKLWKYEYSDVPIKRITLYKFYTKYRKAFEQYKNFGEFKTHYTIVVELDCSAEDFNVDTIDDINTPCREFIATTKTVAIDHPKHFEFIDYPFFTVYKNRPLVKDFRDEWYFEIIKYGEKPSHVLPNTIKKWVLYPDFSIFT